MATVIGARGRKCRVGRAGLILSFLVPLAAVIAPQSIEAQTCGLTAGGTLTGVVNTYYPGVGSPAAGATSISVGTRRTAGAATAIATGDLLLVIQMQDADDQHHQHRRLRRRRAGDRPRASPTSTAAASTNTWWPPARSPAARVAIIGNRHGQRAGERLRDGRRHGDARASAASRSSAFRSTRPRPRQRPDRGALERHDGRRPRHRRRRAPSTLGGTVSLDGLGFRGGAGRGARRRHRRDRHDYRTPLHRRRARQQGRRHRGHAALRLGLGGAAVVDTGVEGYPNGSMARGAPGNAGGGGTDGNPDAQRRERGRRRRRQRRRRRAAAATPGAATWPGRVRRRRS